MCNNASPSEFRDRPMHEQQDTSCLLLFNTRQPLQLVTHFMQQCKHPSSGTDHSRGKVHPRQQSANMICLARDMCQWLPPSSVTYTQKHRVHHTYCTYTTPGQIAGTADRHITAARCATRQEHPSRTAHIVLRRQSSCRTKHCRY